MDCEYHFLKKCFYFFFVASFHELGSIFISIYKHQISAFDHRNQRDTEVFYSF